MNIRNIKLFKSNHLPVKKIIHVPEKSRIKKKITRGSAGTVLGLSILLAGLFDSPAELIRQQTISSLNNNEAIEWMIDEEDPDGSEEEKKKAEAVPQKKGFLRSIADGIKAFFEGLPQAVKMCVCIPLWAIGYGITHILFTLFSTLLSPVLTHVISFVLMAAVLLGIFTVTMKCLFPDMPLKRILSRRNITIVLTTALILKVLDIIVPLFWKGYYKYKYIFMLAAGIALLLVIINAVRRRKALCANM